MILIVPVRSTWTQTGPVRAYWIWCRLVSHRFPNLVRVSVIHCRGVSNSLLWRDSDRLWPGSYLRSSGSLQLDPPGSSSIQSDLTLLAFPLLSHPCPTSSDGHSRLPPVVSRNVKKSRGDGMVSFCLSKLAMVRFGLASWRLTWLGSMKFSPLAHPDLATPVYWGLVQNEHAPLTAQIALKRFDRP